jgi:hypothetical protein
MNARKQYLEEVGKEYQRADEKRKYDKPCTPYERVMKSHQVGRRTKPQLKGV